MKRNETGRKHETTKTLYLYGIQKVKYGIIEELKFFEMNDCKTVNHWVAGSSPAGGAKYNGSCSDTAPVFYCLKYYLGNVLGNIFTKNV